MFSTVLWPQPAVHVGWCGTSTGAANTVVDKNPIKNRSCLIFYEFFVFEKDHFFPTLVISKCTSSQVSGLARYWIVKGTVSPEREGKLELWDDICNTV